MAIIFSDQEERLWLEKLIHPIVKNKLEKNLQKMKPGHLVLNDFTRPPEISQRKGRFP